MRFSLRTSDSSPTGVAQVACNLGGAAARGIGTRTAHRCGMLLIVACSLFGTGMVAAQETKKSADAAEKKPFEERYRLPQTDVAGLLRFIKEQQAFLPDTPEQALVHR